MVFLRHVDYNGETVQEIVENNDDADIIVFSTGIGYITWREYKVYPQKDKKTFKKWVWMEGEYHFKGDCKDIPSISIMEHIEILRHDTDHGEWDSTVIRMNP